jgi:hypothetical protein
MSAPKAEAAGLTVERREELREFADLADAPWKLRAANGASLTRDDLLALLDALAAAEAEVKHWKDHAKEAGDGFTQVCRDYARTAARNVELIRERDEARAAVERVRALADEWYAALDDGCPSCGPVGFSACDHAEGFHHARSKLRAALDTASSEGA